MKSREEEIANSVVQKLARILNKPAAEIKKEDHLFLDLGLDSTHIVELSFLLEEEEQILIEEQDLWNTTSYILSQDWLKEGKLAEEAMHLIRNTYSGVDEDVFLRIDHLYQLNEYLTVQDVIDFVIKKKQMMAVES